MTDRRGAWAQQERTGQVPSTTGRTSNHHYALEYLHVLKPWQASTWDIASPRAAYSRNECCADEQAAVCLTLHGLVHMSMATTFLIPIMARGGYMVADRSLRGPPARPRVPLTGAIRPVKSYTLNDFSASFKTSERRDFFFSLVSPCGLRLCGEPIHFTACLAVIRTRPTRTPRTRRCTARAGPTRNCGLRLGRAARLAPGNFCRHQRVGVQPLFLFARAVFCGCGGSQFSIPAHPAQRSRDPHATLPPALNCPRRHQIDNRRRSAADPPSSRT